MPGQIKDHQRAGDSVRGATTHLAGRADQAAVRRTNLALVLRALRGGPRTRPQLAVDTRLTKATVSSLVAELAERGLARTHQATSQGVVGRPGQRVELVGERVLALGLELNVDYLAAVGLDLGGVQRATVRTSFDVAGRGIDEVVDRAGTVLREVARKALASDQTVLAGVGVAAPGLVDVGRGVVRVAPNLHWNDVPLRDLISTRLARTFAFAGHHLEPAAVAVDNEANLATFAEFSAGSDADDRDLVYLTGGVGVGGGIVVDGRVVRGSAGFAGEVGHLAIDPEGEVCGCGRRGCWETLCGLGALLHLAGAPDDPIHDHERDLDERLDLLRDRARAGDKRTLRAFDQIGRALGFGASMLINLANPRLLVLGGYFARLGEFLLPAVEAELAARVVAPELGGARVELSRLGLWAAATGAAYAALQPLLDDPTRVPATSAATVPASSVSRVTKTPRKETG